jgi:formylglycine-generating enzyme required for sulfatase activity
VGSFAANGFGLHDVIGNVAEWCRESRGSYTDPVRAGDGERQTAASTVAVHRGGDFGASALLARSACRRPDPVGNRGDTIGVRPVRVLEVGAGAR